MCNLKIVIFLMIIVLLFRAYGYCESGEINRWLATFDCRKASNFAEKEICNDSSLGILDLVINAVYVEAKKENKYITNKIKQAQISWLKKRNKCINNDCIRESYVLRLEDLVKLLKTPSGSQSCIEPKKMKEISLSKDINGDTIDEIWIGKCPEGESCNISFFIKQEDCYSEQISVGARYIYYIDNRHLINGHRIMSSESWNGKFDCTTSLYIYNNKYFVFAGKRDCFDFNIPGDSKYTKEQTGALY